MKDLEINLQVDLLESSPDPERQFQINLWKRLENHLEFLEFEDVPPPKTNMTGKSPIFNSRYIFNWLDFSMFFFFFGGVTQYQLFLFVQVLGKTPGFRF